jgi:hypothetical protein
LLAGSVAFGAHYRFDPSEPFNIGGVPTDCDSVWFQWMYDGDTSETHLITTTSLGRTGYYEFDSTVAEAGWYKIYWRFFEDGSSTSLQHEEWYEAIDTLADTNQVNDIAVGTVCDSINAAIADVNKANFKATVDSLLVAIADANKPNFHSDGDTNKFDWDAAFAGSLLVAITDVNKDNFKADTNQAWASTASDTNSFEVEDIIDSFRVLMADSNLARYSKAADYKADVSALALEASLIDTTDIKAALIYWFDKLVTTQNLNDVRYISIDGDNSNGLSLASAWTDFDSIGNLNAPTKILVMPGTYTEVACTVRTSGLEFIGIGGPGITALRGTADTTAYQDRMIVVNPRDTAMASLRISGFNFAHEIPDETADPNFKCAIYIQDSVRYVEVDNNIFIADSNFKTITSGDTYVQYLHVHDNMFAGNRVHALDVAPEYSVISDNYFLKMDSTMNDGVRTAIQLYTGARWNIINDNYFVEDVSSITMVGADSNLVAGNFFGINRSTASEMSGDINSAGNVFTGNHGEPHIKLRESAAGDEIGTWEDRFYNMMKILMFQPPTMSVIPNGDLQLIANEPDSTNVEGWGSSGGTVYITGRRSFGAFPRSLYLESGGYQNTKDVYLHKGLHEVSIWAWLGNAADEARVSAYDDSDNLKTWADGSNFVSGTGYTGWQRIGGVIYLSADDYYYFSLGTPDSTYLTGFTVHPDISGDSTNAAIADANKVNFKADVSGLSTFDHASDKVTLVDSSADGIHDAEVAANAVRDSAQYLVTADLSTLNDPSITEIRQALHDSLYTVRVDSILSILGTVTADVLDIAYYWGACDGCYYRLFPESGTPNKDSAIMIDPSRGADSLVGKIIYLHGTEDAVVDTAYFYRDEPW